MPVHREQDKWQRFYELLVEPDSRHELYDVLKEQAERQADMDRALSALERVKTSHADASSLRSGLDQAKEAVRSLEGMVQLLESVRNDYAMFCKYEYDEPMKPALQRAPSAFSPHSSGLYDAVDTALGDAIEKMKAAAAQTRPNRPAHRPNEPWKVDALAELEAAGIGPARARNTLLRLVGVKPLDK